MPDTSTTISQLVRIAESKDPEAAGHNRRVARYVRFFAGLIGFKESDCRALSEASMFHDLGKVGIPAAILLKPGPLTDDEWIIMKGHTRIGANLIKSPLAKSIALTHHERWDGTGYPEQLSGDRIPIVSRIVQIADQYDALRSPRSYKSAYSHEAAANVILKGDGRTRPEHFDPKLLRIFRLYQHDFNRIYTQDHAFIYRERTMTLPLYA